MRGAQVRARHGFTLVEVMTVVLIVAFGLLPIVSLLSSASRQEALDESVVLAQAMALRLTEQAREELLRVGFEKIERTGGPVAVPLAPGKFTWELVADPVDPEAFLWRVLVKVRWELPTDRQPEASHAYALETLVSRPEAAFTGTYPYRRGSGP